MKAELGPLVKWKGDDGGWKTGREVECSFSWNRGLDSRVIVQHSCNGELEWVDVSKLEPWQTRDEWEDASQ